MSKRAFDGRVKEWRRSLHAWAARHKDGSVSKPVSHSSGPAERRPSHPSSNRNRNQSSAESGRDNGDKRDRSDTEEANAHKRPRLEASRDSQSSSLAFQPMQFVRAGGASTSQGSAIQLRDVMSRDVSTPESATVSLSEHTGKAAFRLPDFAMHPADSSAPKTSVFERPAVNVKRSMVDRSVLDAVRGVTDPSDTAVSIIRARLAAFTASLEGGGQSRMLE